MTTEATAARWPARPDMEAPMSPGHDLRRRLTWALDRRVMTPYLAARLGTRLGAADGPCRVLDAKLEPGVRAVVLYEYAGRLVRGDVAIDDDDSPAWRPPGRTARSTPSATTRGTPGAEVRLSPFPDDPQLPLLPRVVDPTQVGPALAHHLEASERRRWMRRCQVDLVRYRPGKRVTVLATTGAGPQRYVVKGYHDADKATAVAADTAGLAAAGSNSLRLAPFVGAVPLGADGPVLVHEVVSGASLGGLVESAYTAPTLALAGVARAGRALAELHGTTHRAARPRPELAEVRRFGRRAEQVAVLDPGLAEALGRLAERLQVLHRGLPPGCIGTVHGDCKPSQFLVDRHVVYLLDLDHVGLADQAADVGTFLASLRQLAVRDRLARRPFPAELARAMATTFLVNYAARRDHTAPSAPRVAWHQAAALERKALRAFARAPRSPLPTALVAAAHGVLDRWQEG